VCDGLGGPPGRTADVDEADQRRDLDERTHYRGKGLARADTEGRDGHRDGELEVVASGRERERGSLFVVEAEATGERPPGPVKTGRLTTFLYNYIDIFSI